MPVIAEKKYTVTRSDVINKFMEGYYTGIVAQACQLQMQGFINEEKKLALIELGRENFYEKHTKPKEFEIQTIKSSNKQFKERGFICMPTTKP